MEGTQKAWSAFLTDYAGKPAHQLVALAKQKQARLEADAHSQSNQVEAPPEATLPGPETQPATETTIAVDEVTENPFDLALQIQSILKESGCYRGTIDGILGNWSLAALALFSEQAGSDVKIGRNPTVERLSTALGQIRTHAPLQCPVRVAAPTKVTNAPTSRKSATADSSIKNDAVPEKECFAFNGKSFCN